MKPLIVALLLFTLNLPLQAKEHLYIEAGMPASDREWVAKDYQRFLKVVQTSDITLPKLNDKNNQRYFQRLINTENLSFSRQKSLPLSARMQNVLGVGQSTNEITKIYLQEFQSNPKLHSELANLQAFGLQTAKVAVKLIQEFIPSIPKDDSYEKRLQGVKQMCRGLTTVMTGAQISLSETKVYTNHDLIVIINSMHDSMPVLMQCFSPEYRTELALSLKQRIKKLKALGIDVNKIQGMITSLKTA